MPVAVPPGVAVKIAGNSVAAEGPNGALRVQTSGNIAVRLEQDRITVTRGDEAKRTKSLHGLYRKLIHNMVTGVATGFRKVLLINGVGYRAEAQGRILVLNLGYSNPISYAVREGIDVEVEGGNRIVVSGADRQAVGQVAAEIRALRPPEPYKGKGVRYENEFVRRKAGKAMVAGA